MPRRRQPSNIDLLVKLPWWILVIGAALVYFIPPLFVRETATDISSMVKQGLINGTAPFAPVISLFLLALALLSFIKSYKKKSAHNSVTANKMGSSKKRRRAIPNPNQTQRSPIQNPSIKTKNIEPTINRRERITPSPKAIVDLSIEILKSIEWFSFELLCKLFFESLGYNVTKTGAGADGGIDLILYTKNSLDKHALVQCKTSASKDIGVKVVRELFGVITSEKVNKGILISNTGFSKDAINFANSQGIDLVDVYKLWTMIDGLADEKKDNLVKFLGSIDYTTPTCPKCEVKLIERVSKNGKNIGGRFWGCKNYPRCRSSLYMSN
jgi:restriction system protein